MDKYFREALEGLRDAAQHLMAANEGLVAANHEIQAAGTAFVQVTNSALHAHHEHEDLGETVRRLEGTVLDLVTEVRNLRGQNGQK